MRVKEFYLYLMRFVLNILNAARIIDAIDIVAAALLPFVVDVERKCLGVTESVEKFRGHRYVNYLFHSTQDNSCVNLYVMYRSYF